MPNSYVLARNVATFQRPNNTTAYPTFSMVSDGTLPFSVPAPVRDRPFYIRRVVLQVTPGLAAANTFNLLFYNADVSGIMTFIDQGFINNTSAGVQGFYEARNVVSTPANAQIASIDASVNNFALYVPSGVYFVGLETQTAFTPTAQQRFTLMVFTEYSN